MPYKSEMKIKDYNMFRGYYCGLCKTLGKNYNQLVRMGLNYDLSFLAITLSSLEEDRDTVKFESCISTPLKKKMIVDTNRSLEYTSNISIILIYFKLLDDWKDEKSIKSLLANIPFSISIRKAKKHCNSKYVDISRKINELSKLENDNCEIVDEVADKFGRLMESIAIPDFIEDESTRRILKSLGYNLGRWIYILDAFDDIESDIKSGSYNPILLQYQYKEGENINLFLERIKDSMEFSFIFTLENISKSFELLNIKHNRAILENIIYMGMRSRMDNIFNKKGGKEFEKSI